MHINREIYIYMSPFLEKFIKLLIINCQSLIIKVLMIT